ncbi:M48 family metalloprotease [Catalinimonas sp. 4WD22]|uniref:M48 family metalloprotease n=1 Tax=Catalinimonas locisalis TaxID=3133978 RepID=UPI003100CAF2
MKLQLSFLFGHIILIVLAFNSHFAQAQKSYQPLDTESSDFSELKNSLFENLNNDVASLQGPYKEEIAAVYQQRYDDLIYQIDEGHFIADANFTSYFNEIFDKIIQANPDLQNLNPRLLISRYTWPNASCLGEGTLLLNIGLIRKLEHPDQLAFVLCHELAHYSLDHVNIAIAESIKALNTRETQKKLKKAQKRKFRNTTAVAEVLKEIAYKGRRHSRKHEKAADSLALSYFYHTKYDLNQAIRTLEILDSTDVENPVNGISLEQVFQSSEYPFNHQWLALEESLSFGVGSTPNSVYHLHEDSLKTHPDCQKRIDWLQQEKNKQIYTDNEYSVENPEDEHFDKLLAVCELEIISSEYKFQQYGRCLYLTLNALQKYPNQAYLHSMIGKCLYQIYQAQEKHVLASHVDLPSPKYTEEYNKVLNFIHHLRLSELAQVGYYYMKKHSRNHQENEDFLHAQILSCELMHKTDEISLLREKYQSLFINGKYTSEINQY